MKKRISTLLMVMFALFTCQQTALAQAAQIYFEQTEVSYDLSLTATDPFVAPKLINPDGVQVWYQSSDYSGVQVGYYDGIVTIFKEGVYTITADSYEAGSASYILTVTDSREGSGISFDVEEVTYDITSGEEFVAPVLNNPNGVNVMYTCSNWSVASVDYMTGNVTINGVGETVIGASSDAVGDFKPTYTQYILKVIDPEIIYTADFAANENGWTEEGATGIWNWNYYGYMYSDGNYKVNETTDCYLVSPEIDLDANGNLIAFDHMASGFNNFAEQARLVIREVGGEWTVCDPLTTPEEWQFSNTGKLKLPDAFNGKKVQIGFKYTTDGFEMIGQWYIKNVFIKKYVQKADPQISFEVTEITHDISMPFEAPVLNNPNDVVVEYSTMNTDIAMVDVKTGKVTFYGEGDVTIIATSKENKEFDSAKASYVVHVTDNNKIFEASFMSDLCGFTEESTLGNIWVYNYSYALASKGTNATEPTDCFLISPVFTLKSNNVFEFEQLPQLYYGQNLADIAKFAIREVNGDVKGDWVFITLNYPAEDVWSAEKTGTIEIPAEFNNKTVQVAFDYVANGTDWQWWVRNLVIRGEGAAEKADPQISFEVGDVEAILGQEFVAPSLYNPNNVEVVYSSKNPEVATVDAQTGVVTLVSEGWTTITATSVETEQFKSVYVNYVLTVKPAAAGDIIFEENFQKGLGEFTLEGEGAQDVWTWSGNAHADGYGKAPAETVTRLISPVITLKSNNILNIIYGSQYFSDNRIKTDMMASVRLVGGEWVDLEIPECLNNAFNQNSGDIVIPSEFDGKEVQVALKYVCAGYSSGIWDIVSFVVRGSDASAEKKDPELAFEQDTYEFVFDSSKFDGAKLINPYNVEVTYEIKNNDYSVGDVEPYTGVVWVYDYGTVVITAKFEGNDEFKAAEVSYTLNVVDVPTGIEGITADDLKNGKVYTIDGVRVNKLGKGVYIVNGKKVVIK